MTEASPALWAVLNGSFSALRSVVEEVEPDAWPSPSPCNQWSARQVLEHAAGDQLAWAATVAGAGPLPDYDPFQPSGSEPGTAAELLNPALAASAAAWAAVSAATETVPTPLPQGKMPPEYAVAACAMDAAIHAWDIAMATGQPSPLSNELAVALEPAAQIIAEPLREYGVFGPIVSGAAGGDSGAAERLLRFLGRDPNWGA
ncbi:uncharacterized protein (TIGR03086 family) [Jatrophihabitans sp. GAS493]|uniref:TIGR03086 family metal-binding protein n=1 Tax=Jatrophihabitans sp. GAS493 TaxID=1907575 RepID=UPI000BB895B7|nr:TIGR03086 family metal-binding protein [Jatrophihabitans sp. GAS493]SOD71003.1 uncharacterized protein (TIGR03086 family) [Jatrophihabitans sp. GAS493]